MVSHPCHTGFRLVMEDFCCPLPTILPKKQKKMRLKPTCTLWDCHIILLSQTCCLKKNNLDEKKMKRMGYGE